MSFVSADCATEYPDRGLWTAGIRFTKSRTAILPPSRRKARCRLIKGGLRVDVGGERTYPVVLRAGLLDSEALNHNSARAGILIEYGP